MRVKATLSQAADVDPAGAAPGVVLDGSLLVACGQGAVRLLRLQREGRGPQDAAAFLRGTPIAAGGRLG